VVRYDVEGLDDTAFQAARMDRVRGTPVDLVVDEDLSLAPGERILLVEYLPGQYDQRADSAAQCLQLLSHGARPTVATARVYVLKGLLQGKTSIVFAPISFNPVDSREAALAKPETLNPAAPTPDEVDVLEGFITADETSCRGSWGTWAWP